ncbi:MAG: hypothetical protein KKF89_02785 [Nanoarchaeota archaeon]|nr:hypothetical protein [Nanoarchaeota archaeon]MBU1854619.1 hypothetical protein [Nanoarchaeota archaeon]
MEATIQPTYVKRTPNPTILKKTVLNKSIDKNISAVKTNSQNLVDVNKHDDELLSMILGVPIKQIENYGTLQCQLTQNPNNKSIIYCEGPSIHCKYRRENNECKYFKEF